MLPDMKDADWFSRKVVSLRAVPDADPDGSGVSSPRGATRSEASKSAAPSGAGARPNLTVVPDDWQPPIAAPVREFICAHVNLRYAVPISDRDKFDKLLDVYDGARDNLVDYLRDGGDAA